MGQIDARKVRRHFDVPCEQMAVGFILFENDVRATLEVGRGSELPTGMRLRGTDGFIEVSWGGTYGEAAIYGDPDWQPPEQQTPDAMPAVVRNNLDCLESGEEPELSVQKALRAAEIIFAIYESSRSRARIDLPLQSADSALLSMLEAGELQPEA
jgi:predicted dehydrogenase